MTHQQWLDMIGKLRDQALATDNIPLTKIFTVLENAVQADQTHQLAETMALYDDDILLPLRNTRVRRQRLGEQRSGVADFTVGRAIIKNNSYPKVLGPML